MPEQFSYTYPVRLIILTFKLSSLIFPTLKKNHPIDFTKWFKTAV